MESHTFWPWRFTRELGLIEGEAHPRQLVEVGEAQPKGVEYAFWIGEGETGFGFWQGRYVISALLTIKIFCLIMLIFFIFFI